MTLLALALACSSPAPPKPDAGHAPAARVQDPDHVRIIAIGDTGRGNATQRKVARSIARVCTDRPCDLLLLLGDNLYQVGMEGPHDPRMDAVTTEVYGSLGLPTYLLLGNHDHGRAGREPLRARWQVDWANRTPGVHLPSPYYAFEAGPAAFFALDTTDVFWNGETEQDAWLAEALAGSSARWKVVLGHHPFRSNGAHGNAGAYDDVPAIPGLDGRGASLKRLFDGRLCGGGAQLYLSGHDHNRQWIQHCGIDLVVSGAGATARPIVDRGNVARFAQGTEGFVWIDLGPDGVDLVFFDADGMRDGPD